MGMLPSSFFLAARWWSRCGNASLRRAEKASSKPKRERLYPGPTSEMKGRSPIKSMYSPLLELLTRGGLSSLSKGFGASGGRGAGAAHAASTGRGAGGRRVPLRRAKRVNFEFGGGGGGGGDMCRTLAFSACVRIVRATPSPRRTNWEMQKGSGMRTLNIHTPGHPHCPPRPGSLPWISGRLFACLVYG